MTATMNRTSTTAAGLGALLSEHAVTRTRQYGNLVGGLMAVGLGLVALIIEILAASADPRYVSVCGGAGLITLAVGIWSIWTNRREQDLAIRLFQAGIVYAANGRSTTVRWDEVTQMVMHFIYNRRMRTTTHVYRLQDVSGKKLNLQFNEGQINDLPQLGQAIQREVNGRLLPQMAAAVNSGQKVRFGKFSVDQQGIGYGKKHLPWAETAAVEMQRGVVNVWRHDSRRPWARAQILHIPNVVVLTTLAKQRVSQAAPQ